MFIRQRMYVHVFLTQTQPFKFCHIELVSGKPFLFLMLKLYRTFMLCFLYPSSDEYSMGNNHLDTEQK